MADQKLRLVISGDVSSATKAMRQLQRDMEKTAKTFGKIGDTLSTYVTLPILAVGVASTKMAMDAVESENLFAVSLGKMAGAARTWSEDISTSLGLNSYEVRKYIGTYDLMFKGMGIGEEQALKMGEAMTKLAYDMTSFYNVEGGVAEAFRQLQSGLTGEMEPLKKYGIIVSEANVQTYAWKNGIAKQGKALTDQQKTLARYGYILQQTSAAQGDLARTADSPANKLRRLQQRTTELSITYGTLLLPVMDRLVADGNKLADAFGSLGTEQQKLVIYGAGVVAIMGPVSKAVEIAVKAAEGAMKAYAAMQAACAALSASVTGLVNALVTLPFAFGAVVNWFDRDRIAADQNRRAQERLRLEAQGVAVSLHQTAAAASKLSKTPISSSQQVNSLNRIANAASNAREQLERAAAAFRQSEIAYRNSQGVKPHASGGYNPGVKQLTTWGEDGPEYIIPTSPRYRARALGLTRSLLADLGGGGGNVTNVTQVFPLASASDGPTVKHWAQQGLAALSSPVIAPQG